MLQCTSAVAARSQHEIGVDGAIEQLSEVRGCRGSLQDEDVGGKVLCEASRRWVLK